MISQIIIDSRIDEIKVSPCWDMLKSVSAEEVGSEFLQIIRRQIAGFNIYRI